MPLGTLDVRRYLSDRQVMARLRPDYKIRQRQYPTDGPVKPLRRDPVHREGGLYAAVRGRRSSAKRYDIAIMSTKGTSVTASRKLVDSFAVSQASACSCFHDFDKAGFSIVGTLEAATPGATRSRTQYRGDRRWGCGSPISAGLPKLRRPISRQSGKPKARAEPEGERRDRGGDRVPARPARRAERIHI